ncbi:MULTISPECIES: nucleotide exchange factor GrpE [Solibacillus]|uniref:nucleotide exchange factor GrpE n=1 Tax=Solibacillus TaxID=648800 RepID=UPI00296F4370|nr:nucleotide exchange factor GrpE [Solibacillus merdavium]
MSETTKTNEELQQEEIAEQEEVVETAETEETVLDEKEQKIAELEAKLAEEDARYLRLRADYDNLSRRSRLDRESAEKYRAQSLLTELLPALDNLDRALKVEVNSEEAASLYKGVEMVYQQLLAATEKEGLVVIPAEGETFDPNFHQAVMQEQDSEKESGIILRELQKGYKLKDRVLRPSMVSVNE